MSRRPVLVAVLLASLAMALPTLIGARTAANQSQPDAAALFKDLRWRNLGPANMAGRISDIEAVEANPSIVYVGSASGGVWKSVNAGTTWEPIFTRYGTSSIGDVAIFQPNPDIIWVGSGEDCVRNSVAWGDGIYKSTDGGKTFTNVGLRDTHHIARVITHPKNPDIVYVAAQGHLWGYNAERGIYKTTDGGKTWRKLTNGLPNDDLRQAQQRAAGSRKMTVHPTQIAAVGGQRIGRKAGLGPGLLEAALDLGVRRRIGSGAGRHGSLLR